jgi:hypothetical protein
LPILEIDYRVTPGWAHPIRRAIESNPILAIRDRAWSKSSVSDLAFAIETRLTYLPQIVTFIDDNINELNKELVPGVIRYHLARDAAFTFRNIKAMRRLLFGTTAFVTESRSCFENLAGFYRCFLDVYCDREIDKKQSYSAVARATQACMGGDTSADPRGFDTRTVSVSGIRSRDGLIRNPLGTGLYNELETRALRDKRSSSFSRTGRDLGRPLRCRVGAQKEDC